MAISGLLLALGGILAGLFLEGGRLSDVSQLSAALIVFGGTCGAIILTTPWANLKDALARARAAFLEPAGADPQTIEEIAGYAIKARRHGVVALEADASETPDAFLQKALTLAADGTDLDSIRKILEREIQVDHDRAEAGATVFESAGGYAPTLGMMGAVIGLIEVMKSLDDLSRVGSGIAVAFVATVYGLGSANLLFLPVAQKIRLRAQQAARSRQLMLEGVLAVAQQLHPRIIRQRLEAFTPEGARVDHPTMPLAETAPGAASA